MNNISWKNFEINNPNVCDSFENFCRLIFKIHFVKDKYYNLIQTYNNPGIETVPVEINDRRIGFQAKYFDNSVKYKDFYDSFETTLKYYKNKIDEIILFCNKDLNLELKNNYVVRLMSEAKNNNIKITPFCNKSILDLMNFDEYCSVREIYFGGKSLSKKWFDDSLSEVIGLMNPRYISQGVHVSTKETENIFNVFYRNKDLLKYLKDKLSDLCDELNKLSIEIIQEVIKDIKLLKIPELDNLTEIFDWHKNILEMLSKYNNEEIINRIKPYIDKYLNFKNDNCIQYLNDKLLIVEGDAGMGKTHLLGFNAEKNRDNIYTRTILLLGQKFGFSFCINKKAMLAILTDETGQELRVWTRCRHKSFCCNTPECG